MPESEQPSPGQEGRGLALDLLSFIDQCPSPWHVGRTVGERLRRAGFEALSETAAWELVPGAKRYVIRDDSSIAAFIVGRVPLLETGFGIVGAHTDSPGLRVKPRGAYSSETMIRLGVEIYGSPILATFTDRDLRIAGRLVCREGVGLNSRLVDFPKSVVRLPNLAIHMNRSVNEEGLKLQKQMELPLLLAAWNGVEEPSEYFRRLLAEAAQCDAGDILSWDLHIGDGQPGALWGPSEEFLAASQLDNLASCHAAISALERVDRPSRTIVCALFDHEEIGSESRQGAGGSLLGDVLERLAHSQACAGETYRRVLARSFMVSADMAHAYHPNFPAAYEPQHALRVNAGPAIKTNANQRYATSGLSEAVMIRCCEAAGVPYQRYSHRTDLACGSTIGPMTAASLGLRVVDIGSPMWAMHSARESAGAVDHFYLTRALEEFYSAETAFD